MLLPVLSSSALGFVNTKPSNLQLYLKTTCLSGSIHNTLVSSLEVIPWGLHLKLLAICPKFKGNFSVAERAPLLQPLMMKSLACYVPTCPGRDSQDYFCSLCATELHAETTTPWGNEPHGSSSVIGPASPAHNLKGWVETPLEEFQRLAPLPKNLPKMAAGWLLFSHFIHIWFLPLLYKHCALKASLLSWKVRLQAGYPPDFSKKTKTKTFGLQQWPVSCQNCSCAVPGAVWVPREHPSPQLPPA